MANWEFDPQHREQNKEAGAENNPRMPAPPLRGSSVSFRPQEEAQVNAGPAQAGPACKLPGFGSFFRKTFSVYKNNFWVLLLLSSLPIVLSHILSFVFLSKPIYKGGLFLEAYIPSILVYITVVVVSLWSSVSVLYTLKERENKISIGGALKKGLSNFGSYLWVSFLVFIIVAGGFILFIIPGIIFSIWFSLSLYVLVYENKKGMSALKRSKELISGYIVAYFGRTLLFGLVVGGIIALASLIIKGISSFLPLVNYGLAIVEIIAAPVAIIFSVLVFERIKKLKESGCAKSPRELRYLLMPLLLILPLIGILITIVLVNVNSARSKAKDVGVQASMSQMRAYAEIVRDSDVNFGYGGVSCVNPQMASLCDNVRDKTGQNPVIYSSQNAYCAYTKLPGGSYYCVDSLGNALNTKTSPSCSSITLSCR